MKTIFLLSVFLVGFFANAQTELPKLTWSGDIRYRSSRAQDGAKETRLRQQLRARLGVRAEVNENTDAVFRLMTATSPISGNQDLGDSAAPGMVRRGFGLDWGYIDWNFNDEGEAWLGRVANPLWSPNKVQTMFDADMSFEGLALRWNGSGFFASAGAFMISDNYNSVAGADQADQGLAGVEVGYALKGEGIAWTSRVGHIAYANIDGAPVTSAGGNSTGTVGTTTVYTEEYSLWELGTEFKHKLGATDMTYYAEYILNEKADKGQNALEAGVSAKISKLTLGVAYILKEKDSVVAAFTDSDTGGGGTDQRGERLTVGYALAKNVAATLDYWMTDRGISGKSTDYKLAMLNLMASF
ncbi:MAG TPA: putative porin [Bdellovibrionales bacterium]|nr:putative porin [Bdellovibrionales bacterium]